MDFLPVFLSGYRNILNIPSDLYHSSPIDQMLEWLPAISPFAPVSCQSAPVDTHRSKNTETVVSLDFTKKSDLLVGEREWFF